MGLFVPGLSAFNFTYDNWGANPSGTPGTSVVPGATNAEGAWTQVASGANIAQDCYWAYIKISGGATSVQQKNHLIDIGVDPAGGTSYTAVISNMVGGQAATLTASGGSREWLFPLFIKAGSSVAVRVQGSNATAGTVRIITKFWGRPTRPEACPVGAFSQTFGAAAGSLGTSFTPGNAADGAWVDLGATSNPLWWWQFGVQVNNTVVSGEAVYVDIAYGDVTNKHIITRDMLIGTTLEAVGMSMQTQMLACSAYRPVPSGANVYIRGRCQDAPDTGYNGVVIGVGG